MPIVEAPTPTTAEGVVPAVLRPTVFPPYFVELWIVAILGVDALLFFQTMAEIRRVEHQVDLFEEKIDALAIKAQVDSVVGDHVMVTGQWPPTVKRRNDVDRPYWREK